MDLLTTTGVVVAPRGRALRLGLGISATLHILMAAVLLNVPARTSMAEAPIEIAVDVVAEVAPEPARSPPPAAVAAEPRRRVPEARRPSRAREPRPEPTLTPSPHAVAEAASPEQPPAPAEPNADAPASVEITPGPRGVGPPQPDLAAEAGRRPGLAPPGLGQGGGVAQHRVLADRYRTDAMGSRIRQVFRYPGEARELELAGRVSLRVAIARDGRLLEVRLSGPCPHAILCADGLRTIRAAAPFPPIPPELGPSLTVEVPLTYAFAGE